MRQVRHICDRCRTADDTTVSSTVVNVGVEIPNWWKQITCVVHRTGQTPKTSNFLVCNRCSTELDFWLAKRPSPVEAPS